MYVVNRGWVRDTKLDWMPGYSFFIVFVFVRAFEGSVY